MADLTIQQQDNIGVLRGYLDQFGLGSQDMMDTVKGWIVNGYSPDRVKLELPNTPQFKQQFPEYDAAIAAGHPMTPADILNYRTTVTGLMKNAGLPEGFYDSHDDFVDLISKGLSPQEIQSRVNDGFAKVANAPQEVKDAFNQYFGAQGDNYLASFFLDPTKATPVIQKDLTMAQIGGAGAKYGFNIDQSAAAAYAEQGVSGQQAQQGFQQADQLSPLAQATMGETGDISKEQIAQGVLLGGQAAADTKRRQEERGAQFRQAYGGAGGGVQSQGGIGVGGAPQT